MCARRRPKSFLIADILGEPTTSAPAPAGASCTPMRRHTYPVCPLPLRYPPPAPPAPSAAAHAAHAAHVTHAAHVAPLPAPPCCAQLPLLPPPALRHAYSLDSGAWWRGAGGAGAARRAGGQVRFSAAQASALERRFCSARYLSPDQRRRLARDLRLSDRQVKTWFQNRRAKWRRAATGNPARPERERAAGDEAAAPERDAECEPVPPGERDSDSAPPPPPPAPRLPRRLGTVLAPDSLQRAY